MSARYSLEPDGLIYLPATDTDKDGNPVEKEPIWLCSPLNVVSLAVDEEGQWGKLIELVDPNGQQISWVMPAKLLAKKDELWQALLAKGVSLASSGTARNLLHDYVNRQQPVKRARVVSRLGWYLDGEIVAFVRPDIVLGNSTETDIIYQNGTVGSPYGINGTVQDWSAGVGQFCIGNSRLTLAASAAFAAPLLLFANEEGGGINFQGESRSGKTTTMYVAASVGGSRRMVALWRATSNGLEAICEERCDGLLCLDEMGQVDAREAGEIAYMIANGKGKSRMTRATSLQKVKEWRVLFLSSGEISLADKMTEIGKKPRAGQQVRLIDVPADAGAGMGIFENLHGHESPGAFAEHLRRATADTYGASLYAFIDHIAKEFADDPAAIRSVLRQQRENFIRVHLPPEASGQVRTGCGRFALIATAGELATDLGLTGWPTGTATDAAVKCFQAWLGKRGSTGDHDIEAGIRQVITYVEQYGSSRFEDLGFEGASVANRVGFRKERDKTSDRGGRYEYLVLPLMWEGELCRGYDHKAIAKEMAKRGQLLTDKGRVTCTVRCHRHGAVRVYRLAPGIINGVADAPDTRTEAQRRQAFIDWMMSDPDSAEARDFASEGDGPDAREPNGFAHTDVKPEPIFT